MKIGELMSKMIEPAPVMSGNSDHMYENCLYMQIYILILHFKM